MCIFQSEQDWIKKKCTEMHWFHWKKEWPPNLLISIHWIIMCVARCWDAQKYTPKPTNIAELKTALK